LLDNGGCKTAEIEKSEIVRHILQTLIDISSRKTTKGHAVFTMSDLIKKLQIKYDFLKNVEIKDTRYIESEDPVYVIPEINSVKPDQMGKALHDIINNMNRALGEDAGHFFIKELRTNIGDEYSLQIENMGLDLGLMQLEDEVSRMTKKLEEL